MSDSADSLNPKNSASQSAQGEYKDCEARLRYVLAYIGEKRYRRWTASTAIFLLIFYISEIPFGFLYSFFALDVSRLTGIGPNDIFSPVILGLVLLATTFIPPLTITLVIFSRLSRIYRGY